MAPGAASRAAWRAAGAAFDEVPARKQTRFGYTPHLPVILGDLTAWAAPPHDHADLAIHGDET